MTNRCNAWRMWIRISLALAGIFANAVPSLAQSDANAAQNPIANQVSVPIQNDTYFNVGPFGQTQNLLLRRRPAVIGFCLEGSRRWLAREAEFEFLEPTPGRPTNG